MKLLIASTFYDLNKRRLVRRNVYAKEGENGILFTHKIFVKSLDSIYLYCIDDKKILLTNFQGDVLDRYTIPDIRFVMTHMLAPFVVVDNDVFASYMTLGDNRQQAGHRTMVKLNLATGKFEEFGPQYPDVFSRHLYNNFMPYFTFGPDNNIVVQHGALPVLYNYSITRDSTMAFNMRSRLQQKDIVPDTIALEAMEMDDDFEELVQPSYAGIFYDKFKKLYYSVYLDGIPYTIQRD